MRKIFFLLTFVAIGFLVSAQETNIYLSKGFSSEDRTLISKAKRDIQRAKRLMQLSQKNYDQYRELLESSKKGKQKKGERKTVQGKKYLQQAALYYDKGYQQLFEVYFNYVGTLKFDFPENQTKAMELKSQAETEFNQGQRLLRSVRNYEEKELKKKVHFKKLMSTVKSGIDKELGAVEKLVQAIDIYNQEARQREMLKQQEEETWKNAVLQNTIEAYEDYLNRFPEGSHVSEARSRIEDLKKAKEQATDTTVINMPAGGASPLIYRIQVYASKKPVSPAKIRATGYSRYGVDGRPVYSIHFGGYYKYYVGEYKNYEQAKADKMKIKGLMRRSNPFVVGFYNGEPLKDIHKAIAIEKQLSGQQ